MSTPWKAEKNPFTTFNKWDEQTFRQHVTIEIGPLDETTNDLTRAKGPNVRYWKRAIIFKHKEFTSTLIKFSNVQCPYIPGTQYGAKYMYMVMPLWLGKIICEAAHTNNIRTGMDETRLKSTGNIWWKTLNNMKDGADNSKSGTLDNKGNFSEMSFSTIFKRTRKGILVNADVQFFLKANKINEPDLISDMAPTDEFRIATDCSRVCLKDIEIDVEAPPPTSTTTPIVAAVKDDVASDDLMTKLSGLAM